MNVIEWLRLWKNNYVGFPNNYVVIDIETSGLSKHDDLIVQIGHCRVINGRVAEREGVLLDWTRGYVDQNWLKEKLINTKVNIESHNPGRNYPFTYELLRDKGLPPDEVLNIYLSLFEEVRSSKHAFVGHNGWSFDIPFFQDAFKRYIAKEFIFTDNELVDTGVMEKAIQIGTVPWPGESLKRFSQRVYGTRVKGVRWALEDLLSKYGLVDRFKLNTNDSHTADFDAYSTHLLLEKYKELANV